MNMPPFCYERATPGSRLLSLVYPRRCPVCDEIVGMEGSAVPLIHPECLSRLSPVGDVTCLKCGKPLSDPGAEYCRDCSSGEHVFDRGFSLFRYRSISGSVYRFKYAGRQEYADFYGQAGAFLLGEKLLRLGAEALVPVPLHKKKLLSRGYNQAELFAKAIGRGLDIPVMTDLVERVVNTPPMKGLDGAARRNNLKNAFQSHCFGVKLDCVIVVDDIYTTGSTVDAVARVLREAGCGRVYALTLAIGDTV